MAQKTGPQTTAYLLPLGYLARAANQSTDGAQFENLAALSDAHRFQARAFVLSAGRKVRPFFAQPSTAGGDLEQSSITAAKNGETRG